MLRAIALLCLLSACAAPLAVRAPGPQISATPSAGRTAFDAYRQAAARIEPVAEAMCRQANPGAAATFCDFRILVDANPAAPPNAFQSVGRDGRPVLVFTRAMINSVRNDHEIGFILGHEAGHQIRNHLAKTNLNANLGAVLLGSLATLSGGTPQEAQQASELGGQLGARAYSKEHELEADIVGTYIAYLAGYDPAIGARSFARFAGGGGVLSTHPPSAQRLNTVLRTVAQINAQRAAGLPVRLP